LEVEVTPLWEALVLVGRVEVVVSGASLLVVGVVSPQLSL
jgi:hypothetical protein